MKERSYKTLKNTLDRVFAQFIKFRDSIDNHFKCISCEQTKPLDQFNCGHYYSRRYLSLRWNEKNNNGQCVYCNLHLKGNIQGYRTGLISKYGTKVIQELEIIKYQSRKYARFDLEILIKHYKAQIKI